jgi:HEAT repeat protein
MKNSSLIVMGIAVVIALMLAAGGGGLLVWYLVPHPSTPSVPQSAAATNSNEKEPEKAKGPAQAEVPKQADARPKEEKTLFRGKKVMIWIEQSRSPDAAARRESVQALMEVIQEARQGRGVPSLASAALGTVCWLTKDQDAAVAKEAREALGLTGPRAKEVAVALLMPFVGKGFAEDFPFDLIADAIQRVGPEAVPDLIEALNHEDYEIRGRAAAVLLALSFRQRIVERKEDRIQQALDARWARFGRRGGWGRRDTLEAPEKVLTLLEELHERDPPDRRSMPNAAAAGDLWRVGPLGRVAIPELFATLSLPAALLGSAKRGILANPAAPFPERDPLPPELEDHAELLEALANTNDVHLRLRPKVIPELLVLLRSTDRHVPHAEVVRTLGQYGPAAKDAIPVLRSILKQREFAIGSQTMRVLRPLCPVCLIVGQAGASPLAAVADVQWMVEEHMERARTRIIEQDRRENDLLAWAYNDVAHFEIARALYRIDPGSRSTILPVLKSCRRSGDGWVAGEAALLLAEANVVDRDTFEALLRADAKRLSALPPEAQKKLLTFGRPALKSADTLTRRRAAWLLAPLDLDACLPVLLEVLKTENAKDLIATEQTLARLGPKAKTAFAALRARLEQARKTNFAHYDFESEAHSLFAALAHVDPDAALPLLLELWREKFPKTPQRWENPSGHAFDELLRLAPRLQTEIPKLIDDLQSPSESDDAGQLLARIGSPAVPPLRELSEHANPLFRLRAVRSLGQIGADAKPAIPTLCKLLADRDAKVRRESVLAVAKIDPRDNKVIAALVLLRKDADSEVRRHAIRVLGMAGASAAPILAEVLTDSEGEVRLTAVAALGRLGAAGVPALRSALQHKDVQVRRLAVLTLGHLGPDVPETITGLIEATRDRDHLTRRLAVSLLDHPGRETPQVVPILAKALSDEDADVRWTAAFVLEQLAASAKEAVPALSQALTDQERDVRRRALFALRALGPEAHSATSAITKMLVEGDDLHAEAALALLRIAVDPVAAFVETLQSARGMGRSAAENALIQLGARSVPVLTKLTKPENELDVRRSAIRCLGRIDGQAETTVPILVRLLHDKKLRIRLDAIFALGALGPQAKKAIAPLRKIAEDGLDLARDEAARALRQIEAK